MAVFVATDHTIEKTTVYEITYELANGDWVWERTTGLSFQGACKQGVKNCGPEKKLMRIEKIFVND